MSDVMFSINVKFGNNSHFASDKYLNTPIQSIGLINRVKIQINFFYCYSNSDSTQKNEKEKKLHGWLPISGTRQMTVPSLIR